MILRLMYLQLSKFDLRRNEKSFVNFIWRNPVRHIETANFGESRLKQCHRNDTCTPELSKEIDNLCSGT